MASFNKLQPFVEQLAEKVHNLGSDTLTLALTDTAPNAAHATLSQLTQISYTNLSSRTLSVSASAQASGTYKLTIADKVLTASGAVATFRYIYIYNDTAASDELIGYYDYGAGGVTLADGETFTVNFDDAAGVLTLV